MTEQINREDVVQAALNVARYYEIHMDEYLNCDCPFAGKWDCFISNAEPTAWELEAKLRTRGLENGRVQ